MSMETISHPSADETTVEHRCLLDEVLDALPEKYRLPIILHHLEEKTIEEVAASLGLSAGTVAAQVSRGRVLLQKQLVRRGVVLSVGGVAAFLSKNVSAHASEAFVVSTAVAATDFAAGKAAAVAVSSSVTILTKGIMKTLLIEKLTAVTVTSVLCLGVAGIAGVTTYQVLSAKTPTAAVEVAVRQEKSAGPGSTSLLSSGAVSKTASASSPGTEQQEGEYHESKVAKIDDAEARKIEQGHRSVCLSQVRQIGLACKQYSIDGGEKFPSKFSDLFDTYVGDREIFLCPSHPGSTTSITTENVDRVADYVLIQGLTEASSSDAALIVEKKGHHGEEKGGNVFFVGGYARWVQDLDKYLPKSE